VLLHGIEFYLAELPRNTEIAKGNQTYIEHIVLRKKTSGKHGA